MPDAGTARDDRMSADERYERVLVERGVRGWTVFDLLAAGLPSHAARPALIHGETVVSHGELARRAGSLASWMQGIGVQPGDRVGIHLRKGIEEVVATLAAARIGAVFVNVNHQWTPRQLRFVIEDCGLRVLITERRKVASLEIPERLDAIVVVGRDWDGPRAVPWDSIPWGATASMNAPAPEDLAALLYTSGSTGQPKGVMLTHRNIVLGAVSVATYLENTAGDRVLGFLPMSFDYGMSQLTTMLFAGGSVVLQGVAMPAEICRSVVEHRVTGLALVPPMWVQLVRFLQESGTVLDSLRYVTNSGGKIPGAILDAMPEVLPGAGIVLMYGLTEAFRSTYLPPEEFANRKGSIGRAVPGVDVYVIHPERGLCGPGETGELVHRGELVSRGYWERPDETARRIRTCPHLRSIPADEKVLFSGDLVRSDEEGYLWFEGRGDAMIKCSGHRISPTEIEEVVYESGLVGNAVAFGVEDLELGQVVHVAVTAGRDGNAIDGLLGHCQRNLPSYMVPRKFHVWSGDFPCTGSGKLDRPAIVRGCAAATAEEYDP